MTPLEETAVECLRTLPFADGLGVADSWARRTGMGRDALAERVGQAGRRRRSLDRARLAASYVDARSENGGESFSRGRMIELGYVVPDLQVDFIDPLEPWHVHRVDYLWRLVGGSLIVGELDGGVKYNDPAFMGGLSSEEVRAKERQRESRLAMPGVSVMRFSLNDAKNDVRFRRLLDVYGVPRRESGWGPGRAAGKRA